MQSFSEIILLLEKFHLSEKYGLMVCQKFLLSQTSFGFTFGKQSFLVFLNKFAQKLLFFCRVTSFRHIWFY